MHHSDRGYVFTPVIKLTGVLFYHYINNRNRT